MLDVFRPKMGLCVCPSVLQKRLKEGRLYFGCEFQGILSVMVEKTWQQGVAGHIVSLVKKQRWRLVLLAEQGVTGHIVSLVKKQKKMKAGAPLTFSFLLNSGPKWGATHIRGGSSHLYLI